MSWQAVEQKKNLCSVHHKKTHVFYLGLIEFWGYEALGFLTFLYGEDSGCRVVTRDAACGDSAVLTGLRVWQPSMYFVGYSRRACIGK